MGKGEKGLSKSKEVQQKQAEKLKEGFFHSKVPVAERTDETIMFARLAEAAYNDTSARQSAGAQYGFELDEDLSGKWQAIYVNNETQEVVSSFRGTKPTDTSDLYADLHVAIGTPGLSNRFKNAESVFEKVNDKYQDHDLLLTGHSLGGSINLHLNKKYEGEIAEVHNFNPGSGVLAATTSLEHQVTKPDNSHVHQYFIHGDMIASSGRGDPSYTEHVIPPCAKSMNPHTIKQFTNCL